MGPLEGCHKIGRATDPGSRARQVAAKLPVKLAVVHRIETANAVWLERYLHVAFRAARVRGEWFRLSADDVSALKSISRADTADQLPAVVTAMHDGPAEPFREADAHGRDSVPGFPAHLKSMRERKQMSQGELAKAARTHQTSISKLERGERAPSLFLAAKVAAALGVSLEDMIPPGFDASKHRRD